MRTQTVIRKAHRWLGLAIGIQLLAWTISGLYFSIIPIEQIRGEHLTEPAESPLQRLPPGLLGPDAIEPALAAAGIALDRLDSAQLIRRDENFYYRVAYLSGDRSELRLIDARSGAAVPPLDEAAARRRAQALFRSDAPIAALDYITEVAPDSEYRGKPLPAWRARFDHPSGAVVYLIAATGELSARRTDAWRVFDFLWMLHILDFEARDDFSHWLLRGLSALGVITVASGFVLWLVTTPMLRRKRT